MHLTVDKLAGEKMGGGNLHCQFVDTLVFFIYNIKASGVYQ